MRSEMVLIGAGSEGILTEELAVWSSKTVRARRMVTRYSRQDVIRILHLHTRQLMAWERAGLITSKEDYSFEALGQLRKLRDLQATARSCPQSIRVSVGAMYRRAR